MGTELARRIICQYSLGNIHFDDSSNFIVDDSRLLWMVRDHLLVNCASTRLHQALALHHPHQKRKL